MEITYQGLRVVLPLEGVIQAEDFTLHASFNNHARISLSLLMAEEGIEASIHGLPDGADIEVYEEKEPLFKGKITAAEMAPSKGLYYLRLKAVSYTSEWGLAPVSQSFLNLDATYEQVMRKVLENQPGADIKDCITGGAVIPDFLLQYEETDWDFLIRLASHFQSFLIPDYKAGYGRAYFGIPKYDEEFVLSEEEYETLKDLDQFYHVNLNGELVAQEVMRWNVRTGHSFCLAQKVRFREISTIVTKIKYRVVNGELCRFYELSREKGCLSVPLKNENIFGMSIPATVKERSGNCVRVQMHIDQEYDSSPNTRYFTYAIESSFIYCMPELESQVHIYFPSVDEKDAIAVHAIRTGGGGGQQSGASGGGYAQNPAFKSFSNVNGAELLLTPAFVNAAAEAGKTTCINLDTSGNVSIDGEEIEINATKNLSIGEPAGEGGEATGEISLMGGTITAQIGEGEGTKIDLTEEAKIIAAFVKLEASDTSPTTDPSAQDVLDMVTAGDEEARQNANEAASGKLVEKYEAGRKKILDGALKILTTVVVVTVVVVGTIATGGAAAVLAPGVIATCGLGATTVISSTADIMEGVQDVQKGRSGDLSQSYNFVRDTLFMGNQAAYDIAKMVNDIAFGVVSGKALATVGKAALAKESMQLICGSKELGNFKAAIQIGGNVLNGAAHNLIDTGKVNAGDLLVNTALGYIQGKAGGRITNGVLGKLGIDGVSPSTYKAIETAVGTGVDTGMDWAVSGLTGKEFDLWQSLAQNGFANALSSYISDPVDAVTGGYIVQTTDFILASLPEALKLERVYRSSNRDSSCIGKGWTFPYGSRIYRDTGKDDRIHMLTITGHCLLFEKQEGRWVNQSEGTGRFSLEVSKEQRRFYLSDVINHTVCLYDESGQLQQVEYPNRQHLTFTYEGGGLSRITTPLGNELAVISKDGKILQITDEIGRRIQYRYEEDLLTDVVHADEGITHYEYDSQGYIASITDENGVRYLENEYDAKGRVVRQQFESGVYQEFNYDDSHRRNTITYSETGKTEVYEYNKKLLTDRIVYEDGTCLAYEYSDQNLKTGEVSRAGARSGWEYDAYGRVIREIRPDGVETHYEYDEHHDLVRVWDTEQKESVSRYDENHNLLSVRERISDKQWRETVYQYDDKGRRISMRDGVGNVTSYQFEPNRAYPSRVLTPKGEETVYEYDRVGRRMLVGNAYGTVQLSYNSRNFVTKRTDGEGYESRWFYDRMGNLTTHYPAKQWKDQKPGYEYRYDFLERLVDTISPLKEHKRLFRNFDGDIVKEIHPVSYETKQEAGEGTRYEYDPDGNCIRILDPEGGTERRFYDPAGNLTKQVLPEAYDKKIDDGPGFTYAYDTQGRLTAVRDPEGKELHRYTYDGHDRVIHETDGEGQETLSRYDGLGNLTRRQISVRREGKTTFYRVIAYRYDGQGNKIEEAYGTEEVKKDGEPAGWHRIHFTYDENNRLTTVEDDYGARARYEYDCLGNRTLEEQAVEEGIKRRIRYSYNKNGWRIKKEEELQGNGPVRRAVTRYAYDENGNVTKITTPGGHEIRRSYDGDDRLIKERVLDKKNGIDRRVSYAYDAAGNLLCKTVEGAEGERLETGYRYDLKDRLTHESSQSGAVTRYLYDRNDQLIQEIRPYGYEAETEAGRGTVYAYDCRGNRICETNGFGQVVEESVYNLQDRPVAQTDGLGNQTDYDYTLGGELREIRRGRGERKKVIQSYEYNARGQIIGITDGTGETVRYKLDGWGRITGIGFSDGVREGYEYTPSGQVSRAVDGNGHAVQYKYNSLGKVRERIDQMGYTETFQYDEEGNLLLHTDRDGNQVYRIYHYSERFKIGFLLRTIFNHLS